MKLSPFNFVQIVVCGHCKQKWRICWMDSFKFSLKTWQKFFWACVLEEESRNISFSRVVTPVATFFQLGHW